MPTRLFLQSNLLSPRNLRRFTEPGHFSNGAAAGYSIHNKEDMEVQLNCLKSRFQFVVSSMQEQMKDELLDKKQKMDQIRDMLSAMKKAAADMKIIRLHKYRIKNAKHQKNLQLL